MGRKGNNNTKWTIGIAVPIIGAFALIFSGALNGIIQNQGSLDKSMYENRPIVGVSFGDFVSYPLPQLQYDGTNYYIDIISKNTGKSPARVIYHVTSDNALISFSKLGPFRSDTSYNYIIDPNMSLSKDSPPLYVKLDNFPSQFQVKLSASPANDAPSHQETIVTVPYILEYQKNNTGYSLTYHN